jgi:aminoglycoside phosphotransferase (APT) family kinase protein
MADTKRMAIARGRTAEVLAWRDGQVLKLFNDGMPADLIERELRAARLVSTADLPTPKLLGEQTLDRRRGLIYERVAGVSLLGMLGTHPWLCVQYARQFAELQAAIHHQRGDGLPPFKDGLEYTIRGIEGLPPDLRSAALDRLARLPDGDALCHFDFHPDQVMMTAAGLIVLDWLTACAGQPAADVARTTVLLRFGPVMNASWLMRILVNLLRGIFFRTYLRRYLELNPAVTIVAIDAWLPVVAVARLAEDIPGEKARLQAFSWETLS